VILLRAFPNSGPNSGPGPRPVLSSIALHSVAVHSVADPVAPDRSASRIVDAPGALAVWHMASLDAPTVAIVWTLGFARAAGVHLPTWAPVIVGLVTWAVYIGDRLLDARSALAAMQPSRLRHRHRFHWRHRRLLCLLAVLSALAGLAIIVAFVPAAARARGAALGLATVAYFSGVHTRRNSGSWLDWLPMPDRFLERLPFKRLGNELLVASMFTCGCMLPVWPRAALLATQLWPLALVAVFFMLLAWLNYHAICRWEANARAGHITTAGLMLALVGVVVAGVIAAGHPSAAMLIGLGAGSAVLLAMLDQNRNWLTPLALRASADLVLLLPLIAVGLRQ
jgi:hypothetical protein